MIAIQASFVVAAHFVCIAGAAQNPDQIMQAEYSERPKALQSAPLEERVPLYLELMLRTEPPDLRLAETVADAGPAIIPSILKAVRTTKQDYDLVNLSLVLSMMQRSGRYSVRENAKLCTAFKTRANEMQLATYREMVIDDLDLIGCGAAKP